MSKLKAVVALVLVLSLFFAWLGYTINGLVGALTSGMLAFFIITLLVMIAATPQSDRGSGGSHDMFDGNDDWDFD